MSSYIKLSDQRMLLLKSGNVCAMPGCGKVLVAEGEKEVIIGEMAHIKGEKPTSARFDSTMSPEDLNSYKNLIFVCSSCHTLIDSKADVYTTEKLFDIKSSHEKTVTDSIRAKILNVDFSNFAELEVIKKYLSSSEAVPDITYDIIPIKDKIKRNELSTSTEQWILMGMTQVKQVERYIDKNLDINFGENLRRRFVAEYEKFKRDGLKSDALFNALLYFATGGTYNVEQIPQGLAVLVYLFEKCEVLEK